MNWLEVPLVGLQCTVSGRGIGLRRSIGKVETTLRIIMVFGTTTNDIRI